MKTDTIINVNMRTFPHVKGEVMTTIKQVALEAGVSKSTVSRFIAQNGYVSDEAREKN